MKRPKPFSGGSDSNPRRRSDGISQVQFHRHRFSRRKNGRLLERDLGEAPQLARMQTFSFLGFELFQRALLLELASAEADDLGGIEIKAAKRATLLLAEVLLVEVLTQDGLLLPDPEDKEKPERPARLREVGS